MGKRYYLQMHRSLGGKRGWPSEPRWCVDPNLPALLFNTTHSTDVLTSRSSFSHVEIASLKGDNISKIITKAEIIKEGERESETERESERGSYPI